MPSLFYQEFFRTDPPLTSLFIEYVVDKVRALPEGERESGFADILAQGLLDCQLVTEQPSDELLISVARRLEDQARDAGEGGAESGSQSGKYFSGYLVDWASKLNPVGLCLYAADYDYQLARTYYCELDQQTLVAIAHDKLRLELERARVGFEAALFGFGGKYKDTPGEADQMFDLTKDSAAAEVAMKNFGF